METTVLGNHNTFLGVGHDPILVNPVEIRIPKKFLSVLHPNLVSSPIKGILEILNLIPQCIPMDILAWTDCVGSSILKYFYL
jgi:hypothetical protein